MVETPSENFTLKQSQKGRKSEMGGWEDKNAHRAQIIWIEQQNTKDENKPLWFWDQVG